MRYDTGRLFGAIEIKRALLILLLFCLPSWAGAALYTLDSKQSSLQFTWSYGGLSDDTGTVKSIHGVVHLNESVPEQSDVSVTIQVADLKTDDPSTDDLLKGEGFFDAARFPTITFVSDRILQLDDDKDQMSGQLTMHGVTRPVTLDITVSPEDRAALIAGHKTSLTLNAQTTINRSDFGMNDYTGFVADPVTVSITAHLKKEHVKLAK